VSQEAVIRNFQLFIMENIYEDAMLPQNRPDSSNDTDALQLLVCRQSRLSRVATTTTIQQQQQQQQQH
jgi:hypothetical protein